MAAAMPYAVLQSIHASLGELHNYRSTLAVYSSWNTRLVLPSTGRASREQTTASPFACVKSAADLVVRLTIPVHSYPWTRS